MVVINLIALIAFFRLCRDSFSKVIIFRLNLDIIIFTVIKQLPQNLPRIILAVW